jgi:hypothetical protein
MVEIRRQGVLAESQGSRVTVLVGGRGERTFRCAGVEEGRDCDRAFVQFLFWE